MNRPLTIRHVLCPFDFSASSRRALQVALGVAERFDARLDVLHVFKTPFHAPSRRSAAVDREVSDRHRRLAQSALDEALASPEYARADSHVAEGQPHEAIERFARASGTDIIVMGTRGNTGLKRLLLGSVAERVVRTAEVPVLTVPRQEAA
jgi:nucleotide-binding universal stress UspA family protein